MSDEEVEAKKSKPSGVHARRGLAKKKPGGAIAVSTEPFTKTQGFYSSCVAKCFEKIKTHDIEDEIKVACQDTANEDIEDDFRSERKRTKLDVSDLPSDNEEKNCWNQSTNSETVMSPSPPPPLSTVCAQRRAGGKQRKSLMTAIKNLTKDLSKVKSQLCSGQLYCAEPDVVVIDDSREITVRVDHHGIIERHMMNCDDTFSRLISWFAAAEDVTETSVMLVLNDRTLTSTDTPLSINLKVADIIKCLIVENRWDSCMDTLEHNDNSNDVIELLVQCQGLKQKEVLNAHVRKPLSIVFEEYAKRLHKDVTHLQFFFDGDVVKPNETAEFLGIGDGDMLDVKETVGR